MGWPEVTGGEELRAIGVHEVGPLQRCVADTVTPQMTFEQMLRKMEGMASTCPCPCRGWSQGLTLEAPSTAVALHLHIRLWVGWGFPLLGYRAPERDILVALKP